MRYWNTIKQKQSELIEEWEKGMNRNSQKGNLHSLKHENINFTNKNAKNTKIFHILQSGNFLV